MDTALDNGLPFTFSDSLAPTAGMGEGGQEVGAWCLEILLGGCFQ